MMKYKFGFYFILILILSTCQKDDAENCVAASMYYKTGSAVHCLHHGYIFHNGTWLNFESTYRIDLIFTNDDVIYNQIDSVFSKVGDALNFSVLCNTQNLYLGTYQFDSFALNANIVGAGHYENYDFTQKNNLSNLDHLPGNFANITSGSLTISKNNDKKYAIRFSCLDEKDDSITGQYVGNLSYIETSN